MSFKPYRGKTHNLEFNKGDILVLFGELFNRGYANGLVEEAIQKEMKIVFSTVGRRDDKNILRPLNQEEQESRKYPDYPFINLPLEAGFDLEPSSSKGLTPNDLCKEASLKEWANFKIDKDQIQESLMQGRLRFVKQVRDYLKELQKHIEPNKNIIFAHLMAGGVPRSKIILSVMNRVFKGRGERSILSKDFWNSDLGYFTQLSFNEVTAETFRTLLEETTDLRNNHKGQISYLAYGYHGTEIYFQDQLMWQSYAPYLQGYAKIKLEDYSKQFFNQNAKCCVYNCPEILTASSSIFPGVEISLYSLLAPLEKKSPSLFKKAISLLKDENDFKKVQDTISSYWSNTEIKNQLTYFENWPQHSTHSQMELMLKGSDDLIELHKSDKELITMLLSELVIKSCGKIMLHESRLPSQPVFWIGHDQVLL